MIVGHAVASTMPVWTLVAAATPTVAIGAWALWDSWQTPRCPVWSRAAIGVSLLALVQWTLFLVLRVSLTWTPDQYEKMAGPLRLLVLSPLGGWGVWFTMHGFSRRSVRRRSTTTLSGVSITDGAMLEQHDRESEG